MSGFDLILAALAATVPAAALGWAGAVMGEGLVGDVRLRPMLWKAARWAALTPLLILPATPFLTPLLTGFAPGVTGSASGVFALLNIDLAWPLAGAPAQGANAAQASPGLKVDPALLLWALYAAGLAFAALRFAGRRRMLNRLLAASTSADAGLQRGFDAERRRLGLAEHPVALRVTDAAVTPFVTGWRPVVVLPRRLLTAESRETAAYALAHELTHVRRGDERDRLLGETLGAILWFNPVLALIEARLCAARELACDAAVLDVEGSGRRRGYAEALLAAASACTPPVRLSAFTPDERRLRKMRIQAILTHAPAGTRKRLALSAALGAVLLAAAPVALAQAVLTAGLTPAPAESAGQQAFSEPMGQLVLQAQTLQHEERWEESAALLDDALESGAITPFEAAVALQMRGRARYEQEDIDRAIADWRAAIDTGAMTHAEARQLRINIGQLLFSGARYDDGIAELEAAHADGAPMNHRLAMMMAQAHAQAGRFEDGLPYARRAFDEASPRERRHYNLMLYYVQQLGMETEATALRDEMRAQGFDVRE